MSKKNQKSNKGSKPSTKPITVSDSDESETDATGAALEIESTTSEADKYETAEEAEATIEVDEDAEQEAQDAKDAEEEKKFADMLKKSLPDTSDKRLDILAHLRRVAPNTRFLTALRFGEAKLLSLCKTNRGFFEMKRDASNKYYSAKIDAIVAKQKKRTEKLLANKEKYAEMIKKAEERAIRLREEMAEAEKLAASTKSQAAGE